MYGTIRYDREAKELALTITSIIVIHKGHRPTTSPTDATNALNDHKQLINNLITKKVQKIANLTNLFSITPPILRNLNQNQNPIPPPIVIKVEPVTKVVHQQPNETKGERDQVRFE